MATDYFLDSYFPSQYFDDGFFQGVQLGDYDSIGAITFDGITSFGFIQDTKPKNDGDGVYFVKRRKPRSKPRFQKLAASGTVAFDGQLSGSGNGLVAWKELSAQSTATFGSFSTQGSIEALSEGSGTASFGAVRPLWAKAGNQISVDGTVAFVAFTASGRGKVREALVGPISPIKPERPIRPLSRPA